MCNGESNRPRVGGTIAILAPYNTSGAPSAQIDSDMTLTFQPSEDRTMATLYSPVATDRSSIDICHVVIHRDGDLRNADTMPLEDSVLHRFPLPPKQPWATSGAEAFKVPIKLDLGVGGDGVIGRRVSFYKDTPTGAELLRHGVIGFN